MGTKGFISLLVGVLVLGLAVGGSFLGGLAIGKGQEVEAATSVAPVPQAPSAASQVAGQTDGQTLGTLRERLQSGDLSQEELAGLREQFQGQFGGGTDGGGFAGGAGFGGRGGLVGTIEKVDGNTVTVNTPQGALLATIGDDTTIQKTIEVPIGELVEGVRVTITGARGEDGAVEARLIFLVAEGQEGSLGGGGGFRGGGGFGGGR